MALPHLVTGGTGFVGAALVIELLLQSEDEVCVLARSSSTATASERAYAALETALGVYGIGLDAAEVKRRVRVIAGDVTAPSCGVHEDFGAVGQVWHAAASLRYENRYVDEINATNVAGTRNMLALAERARASTFNYVSTAYVAGRASGAIAERMHEEADSNNHYERSKVAAESLVFTNSSMQFRLFRPSIVVGHSKTLAATAFSGFYGFLRQLVQFAGMVNRTQEGLLERTALKVRMDRDLRINLIAVDHVAKEAVRIGLTDEVGIFHLTNRIPPTLATVVPTMFEVLGLHRPLFVDDRRELDWLGERFDQRLDFYGSYITGDKHFVRERSDEVLGNRREVDVSYDVDTIKALANWYLEHLRASRTQLPAAR
jgi:thioester reductase-like protein